MHLLRKISAEHLSGRVNVCRGCVWSGKCPLGMCLVGKMSIGDVPGRESVHRGCVWSGKCPSGMCLVGKVSIGDVSGRGNVYRGSVRRGNTRRGCVRESILYRNVAFSILELPTKKRYSSFMKKVFISQKNSFKVIVLKTFKISDKNVTVHETSRSLKWKAILKIPITVFYKNLCSFYWL